MSTENKTALSDDVRGMIALKATWGIDALVILMINAIEDDTSPEVMWATKEVLQRVKQLNSVIMSAIGDAAETTKDLKARVN